VEANEDTDAETGVDLDAGVVKSRCRTRSAVGKQSASAAAAASAVKAAEKKKRKRRAVSPPAVFTPSIPTPHSREVESEEEEEEEEEESEKEKDEAIEQLTVPEMRPARRSESPAAKRQRELVQKTSEDAL
jgi:CO dehydrogenase/acetyl-CoA synthase beta subunit